MIKTKYRYSVEEDDTYEDAYSLYMYDWKCQEYDLSDKWDLEVLVEECAEDFHSNHDGWEISSWNDGREPLRFYIWIDEQTKVAYDIHLEYQPSFTTVRV
jgi:hypothetical protein